MNEMQPGLKQLEPTLEPEIKRAPRDLGGLIALAKDKELPLPLKQVKVRAEMVGDCCQTVVEQHFRNELDQVLEAIYIFPLPEDGAVIEMELVAGDVVVKAECREREEAEKVFEEARESGFQAGLLTQQRADVYTLRFTNLPPKSDVLVRMMVVERLENIDGRWHWRFPTVIAPRYLPGTPVGHEGPGVLPDSDHVPDASHLQPPLRLEGGTEFDLEVKIHGIVRELESSLHAVRVDLGENGEDGVRVAPSGTTTLNRDFVLAFSTADKKIATTRAYTDGNHTLVVIEPPSMELPEVLPRDAVFVIDRSGSMRGPKMEAAKLALKSALHGLQEGDRFKLIAFSSDLQTFDKSFMGYSQRSLEEADAWINQLQARGGTEMLPAIKEALTEDGTQDRTSTVLMITDGQVWNESELVAAVANRRKGTLFFTMGIGTAVSSALLKRLARVGGGTCELLAPSDDIEASVSRLESRFGSPIAKDVIVKGGEPADDRPRSLFTNHPASWLLEGEPKRVRVTGKMAHGEFDFETKPSKITFSLGALWARERVGMLEDRITLRPHDEEALRPEIIQIALEHKIASRFTAFVAVERSIKVTGERVEIVQPVELPQDWDPGFLGLPGADQVKSMKLASPAHYAMTAAPLMRDMEFTPAVKVLNNVKRQIRKSKGEKEKVLPSEKVEASMDGQLARMQNADGSFGEDPKRTAAALITLVLLGHTRRKGIRQRTVLKAADWLKDHIHDPIVSLALEVLRLGEGGKTSIDFLTQKIADIEALFSAGEEGKILHKVWGDRDK
jgi:Ca-activated chloride channel family protein